MKVIKKCHLFEFSKRYPDCSNILNAWLCEVRSKKWKDNFDLIQSFPNTILLEGGEVFFELQPERYYLMASIKYSTQTLSIKGVLCKLLPTQLWKGHLH
jgi:mRNA-degrading endonuclease HigB of HigAB toxin-antitoxin module